jgi:RNA polymerase sigma factor (sigma-70 family)
MSQQQTLNKIIEEVLDHNNVYLNFLRFKVPQQYQDDLLQEVILVLLEHPERTIEIYNKKQLNYYFVRVCMNLFNSNTSPFYKHFRLDRENNSEELDGVLSDDESLEEKQLMEQQWVTLHKALKEVKLDWYENQMITYYFNQNMTYREIEELTGVDSVSTWQTIQNVVKKLKVHISATTDLKVNDKVKPRKLPINVYDMSMNKIKEYNNAQDAGKALGLNGGNITTCCKTYGSYGGYYFRYKRVKLATENLQPTEYKLSEDTRQKMRDAKQGKSRNKK